MLGLGVVVLRSDEALAEIKRRLEGQLDDPLVSAVEGFMSGSLTRPRPPQKLAGRFRNDHLVAYRPRTVRFVALLRFVGRLSGTDDGSELVGAIGLRPWSILIPIWALGFGALAYAIGKTAALDLFAPILVVGLAGTAFGLKTEAAFLRQQLIGLVHGHA